MAKIYENNLMAIKKVDLSLFNMLSEITTLKRFEVFQTGENATDLDIYDHKEKIFFYSKQPRDALIKKLNYIQKDRLHNYLYYFGIGNGFFIQSQLLNHKAKRIVVLEPSLELLYIALNLIDFSNEISTEKLVLFYTDTFHITHALDLFTADHEVPLWESSTLQFELYKEYAKFKEMFISTNKLLLQARDYCLSLRNSDINDSIKGIVQTFNNIERLCKNQPLSKLFFISPSKFAIIVSTGPSLTKQLVYLKGIQSYVTIISVDASLPILYEAGIKPHFVVSMERDEPTAKFFQSVPKAFQKGINFICSSVQHVSVFDAIEDGKLFVTLRPNSHFRFFNLNEYGYLGAGASAANMALDLAIGVMKFEKIIFIGQDLAFGDNLQTHASGHIIDGNASIESEIKEKKLFEVTAYGGKGKVTTHIYWKAFKEGLENTIQQFPEQTVVNSTEGGAQISGTTEVPFEKIAQEVLTSSIETKIKFNDINIENTKCLNSYRLKKEVLLNTGIQIEKEINNVLRHLNQKKTKSIYQEVKRFDDKLLNNTIYVDFFLPIINPSIILPRIKVNEILTTLDENDMDFLTSVLRAYKTYFETFKEYHTLVLSALKQ